MTKRWWALILGISLITSAASAEEHGGGHEAPAKEEGGGGEGKAQGGGEKKEESTLAPWVEVENRIQTLQSKIQIKEENIKHLLEEKEHLAPNSPKLKGVLKELVSNHKELRQFAEEYDKQVTILKYRFPERNSNKERKYERIEVGPIEDLEKSLGIEGKMDKSLKKMRSQYPGKANETEAPVVAKPIQKKEKAKDQSIEEAPSVILNK